MEKETVQQTEAQAAIESTEAAPKANEEAEVVFAVLDTSFTFGEPRPC